MTDYVDLYRRRLMNADDLLARRAEMIRARDDIQGIVDEAQEMAFRHFLADEILLGCRARDRAKQSSRSLARAEAEIRALDELIIL